MTADVPGQSLVLDVRYSGSTNTGIMEATAGGTLWFAHGSIDNTGGVIRAMDAGIVALAQPTITGGELTSFDFGEIRVTGNTTVLADLLNTGFIRVLNDYDPKISGTIVNEGTILLDSAGGYTDLTVASATAALDGGGEVVSGRTARTGSPAPATTSCSSTERTT